MLSDNPIYTKGQKRYIMVLKGGVDDVDGIVATTGSKEYRRGSAGTATYTHSNARKHKYV